MSDDDVPVKRKGIAGMSVPKLVWILRLANFLNAMLLIIIAVLKLQVTAGINQLPLILSCIYVMFFSSLLLCFECHCRVFNRVVYRNFGFMFHWIGRVVFLFVTGSLAFGFGTNGIIAGCVTILNIIFNVYVVQTNDYYKDKLEDDAVDMRARAKTGADDKEREAKTKAKAKEDAKSDKDKGKKDDKHKDDEPSKPYKSAWDDDEEKGLPANEETKVTKKEEVKDEKQRKKEEKEAKEAEKKRQKEEKEAEKRRQKEEQENAKREKEADKQRLKEKKPELEESGAHSGGSSPAASPKATSSGPSLIEVIKMPSGDWNKYADPKTGTFYYYNAYTKETRWEVPTR